jgi:hypothetical protein
MDKQTYFLAPSPSAYRQLELEVYGVKPLSLFMMSIFEVLLLC